MSATKVCTKCGECKGLECYPKMKTGKDGLSPWCRQCKNAYLANYRKNNPEKIKALNLAWRTTNPEKVKAANAEWYEKHPGRVKEQAKKWAKANPEKVKKRNARWHKENRILNNTKRAARYAANTIRELTRNAAWAAAHPDVVRKYNHNRRARRIAAGGTLSKTIVTRLMTLQRGLCACGCGAKLKDTGHHIDHIQPLAKGGSNTDENCQLLTPKCNMSKGAKCPIEWAQSKGFLL